VAVIIEGVVGMNKEVVSDISGSDKLGDSIWENVATDEMNFDF
jgi:hypothetical protein